MPINDVISGASSIGTRLAAFATFMTVSEMRRQRRASYQPHIAISRPCFLASDNGYGIPVCWNQYRNDNCDGELNKNDGGILLKITNLGRGAATRVLIGFFFDYEEPIKCLIALSETKKLGIKLNGGLVPTDYIELEFDGGGQSIGANMKHEQTSIDYILSSDAEKNDTVVRMPYAYCLIISTLMYVYCSKNKNPNNNEKIQKFSGSLDELHNILKIPPLIAMIKHLDIGGNKHQTKFRLILKILTVEPNAKDFRARFDVKQICLV